MCSSTSRKESGYGRGNSRDAIDGYLHPRTMWLEPSGATRDPFVIE